jgi:hypothetical protein
LPGVGATHTENCKEHGEHCWNTHLRHSFTGVSIVNLGLPRLLVWTVANGYPVLTA